VLSSQPPERENDYIPGEAAAVTPIEKQTILITGSTDGLGRAAARELAARGARVLVHGRSPERIEATLAEITAVTGSTSVKGYRADLSELSQVRGLAAEIIADHDHLDLLINNAGIGSGNMSTYRRETSRDGHELRFAVNYLAPFLLTRLLLPLLEAAVPSRIVSVSSVGQAPIDFDDLMMQKRYEPYDAYCRSKLAQIMFTIDLAAELAATGITVNCLHPASLMNTKMVFESFGRTMSTIEDGVKALMNLAISSALDRVTGRYFNELSESRANVQAYDAAARARLKRISEELTGLRGRSARG
jgi:NAD(P)-dependent dehydrogenase (short-subunit alcohol dehydrogenase family)